MIPSSEHGHILVVDDNNLNLRIATKILQKYGYSTETANSGTQALDMAAHGRFDLVLLDIMMPDISGYEVCKQLKATPAIADIPIIFLSALDEIANKMEAFRIGGVDYITKPFQAEEMLARVRTHISLRQAQQALIKKNQQITETLAELQNTQSYLIQAEKMAALGHLVANIAHELNSPLGAMQASVDNLEDALQQIFGTIPTLLRQLNETELAECLAFIEAVQRGIPLTSSQKKRQWRQEVEGQLQQAGFENPRVIANQLVTLGLQQQFEPFIPMLKRETASLILQMALGVSTEQRSSRTIKEAIQRLTKIIATLKLYTHRDNDGQPQTTPLVDMIELALQLYQTRLNDIEIIRHYHDNPLILCYPDELHQAWSHLIHNSLQAMPKAGCLTVMTRCNPAASHVEIVITDNGVGIPLEIQGRIFDPFFSTKSAGEGSGLGLTIVQQVIKHHQGTIAMASQSGETTMTITLPLEATFDE